MPGDSPSKKFMACSILTQKLLKCSSRMEEDAPSAWWSGFSQQQQPRLREEEPLTSQITAAAFAGASAVLSSWTAPWEAGMLLCLFYRWGNWGVCPSQPAWQPRVTYLHRSTRLGLSWPVQKPRLQFPCGPCRQVLLTTRLRAGLAWGQNKGNLPLRGNEMRELSRGCRPGPGPGGL